MTKNSLTGLLTGALLSAVMLVPAPAMADYDANVCSNLGPDIRCYAGGSYRNFLNVRMTMQDVPNYSEQADICAKAITAAGNLRTGSTCALASTIRACLSGDTPNSRGYGSHSGSGNFFQTNFPFAQFYSANFDHHVAAATPSDTVGVCGR